MIMIITISIIIIMISNIISIISSVKRGDLLHFFVVENSSLAKSREIKVVNLSDDDYKVRQS